MFFPKRKLLFAATCLLSLSAHASSAPKVLSIQPGAQTFSATTQPEILVRFEAPVDPASLTPKSFSVFGRWSGVCPGQFVLEEGNQLVRFVPAKSFSAGEMITVSLSKSIKSATGESMIKGYAWQFWTPAQPAVLDLKEVRRINVRAPGEGLIRTYGAYAGDLDGDGFHDFTVPNEDAHDVRVFMNNRAGDYTAPFKTYKLPVPSKPSTNEGADFNGDGLLDFACGNIAGGSAAVFFGNGDGTLQPPKIYPTAADTRGLAVADLNGDGAPDIVTANRNGNKVAVLMNNGDGTFASANILETGMNGETSCAAADANGDGLLDIIVGSYTSQQMVVLLSDGNGGLSVSTRVNCRGNAWMIAIGDIDGDKDVDVVSASAGVPQFAVLRGDGAGQLSAAEVYSNGNFSLAIDLGDIDGDGDLDLVTSNYGSRDFRVFENDGTGRFINPRFLQASAAGSCVVIHDRDRDGDLDITGIDEEDDLLFLFDNPGRGNAVNESPSSQIAPADFDLLQSYPNPFTARAPSLFIPFVLQRAAHVRLEILNLKGERVRLVLNESRAAGRHEVALAQNNLPAGVYFYRLLKDEKQTLVRKMVWLKTAEF
ncbi:MAG: FG-GAP-like repeat-containing protein [candidate division KSB1 bacterium]